MERSKSFSRLVGARVRSFRHPPGLQEPGKALAMLMFYGSRNIGIPSKLRSQPAYMLLGQPGLCRAEPEIHAAKRMKGRTVPSELQLQPTACSDHACRQVHQLLHHRPYSSALRWMANRRKSPQESILPQNTKDVIGKSPERQHQGVGGELSGGQPFQVQIGLDLTVKLFAQTPLFIQGDHLSFVKGKRRPPAIQLQMGPDQHLPFGVRYPLRYPDHSAKPIGLAAVAPSDPCADDRYFLSGPRFRNTALTKGQVAPVSEVRLARIPFDDEGDLGCRRSSTRVSSAS